MIAKPEEYNTVNMIEFEEEVVEPMTVLVKDPLEEVKKVEVVVVEEKITVASKVLDRQQSLKEGKLLKKSVTLSLDEALLEIDGALSYPIMEAYEEEPL